jgi:serine/threonine protein kinase
MDSWGFASEVPEGEAEPEPVAALAKLKPGEHFGPFSLREELGRGSFGVVFRARETESRRELALKIMTRPLQERQLTRFLREGELTASLRHPGIVRIHSAGEAEGLPYLSYELVAEGQTLRPYLRPERREEALGLLEEVASALGHAHALGVVHRDLKPDNVLVTAEGKARVADFGLARRESDEALTRTGAIVGTPSHMAPEQFRGEPSTPQTDVWALGVLLYQALTGELPFQASALLELSVRVAQEPLVPAAKRAPDVHPALDAVCRRALAKDPQERYPDGAAFAEALARARLGLRDSVARGRAVRVGFGALVGLVLVGGAVWISQPQPSPAELALRQALDEERPPGELATTLANADPRVDPALRAAAHLRLASEAPPESRAEHARAALLLGGDPRRAELALALALAEDPSASAELVAALERARAAGAPSALVANLALEEAEALRELGRGAEALALLRERLARPVPEPARERKLWSLRARLELELEPATAALSLSELEQRGAPAEAAALRADAALDRGEDPSAGLRAALEEDEGHWGLRVRLARAALAKGHVATAYAVAASGSPKPGSALPGDWRPERALPILQALAQHPPQLPSSQQVPTAWRELIARWATREARRAQGLAQWEAQAATSSGEGAPTPEAFRARGLALAVGAAELAREDSTRARALALQVQLGGPPELLERAEALAPRDSQVVWAQLARAQVQGAWQRVVELLGPASTRESPRRAILRGEALLQLGKSSEAAQVLRAALGPRELDSRVARLLARALEAGPGEAGRAEAARLRARAELLDSPPTPGAGEALERALLARREQLHGRAEVEAMFTEALAKNPYAIRARMNVARLNFVETGQPIDLREFLWSGSQSAAQFPFVWRDLLHLSRGLIEDVYLTGMAERYPNERREDRLLGALLGVASVEFEGQAEALPGLLARLEAWLEEEPGEHSALRARAFLLLRSGHLHEAERELAVLAEAEPGSQVVAFYQLLCAAQRREPLPELVARIAWLQKQHFVLWRAPNWSIRLYPELAPHAHEAGFEPLIGRKDK